MASVVENIGPAVVMEQPVGVALCVLQAPVCDCGVPGEMLPLHESRGGGASFWHRVQAETSCGPRDQNSCPTGAFQCIIIIIVVVVVYFTESMHINQQ